MKLFIPLAMALLYFAFAGIALGQNSRAIWLKQGAIYALDKEDLEAAYGYMSQGDEEGVVPSVASREKYPLASFPKVLH